jgi:hypothetical protein
MGAMKSFAVVLAICLTSCTTLSSNRLSPAESSAMLDRARERALSSGLLKSEAERQMIMTSAPQVSCYFMAAPYAQYSIGWELAPGEHVLITGQGNVIELEGAPDNAPAAKGERRKAQGARRSTLTQC